MSTQTGKSTLSVGASGPVLTGGAAAWWNFSLAPLTCEPLNTLTTKAGLCPLKQQSKRAVSNNDSVIRWTNKWINPLYINQSVTFWYTSQPSKQDKQPTDHWYINHSIVIHQSISCCTSINQSINCWYINQPDHLQVVKYLPEWTDF